MTRYFLISLFLLISITSIAAQDDPVPKQISGGVLNGRALTLPKPAFPPAARAVGAAGAVTVQVLIDELGNVESATAINGHPLLRAVSVDAALRAKFSPTRLQGNPVKVAGVITYNFVGPLYPAKMGYTLAFAAETGRFDFGSHPKSFASQLPPEFAQEIAILKELTFENAVPKTEPVKPKVEPPSSRPKDPNRYTMIGPGISAATADKLDERSIGALRNLMASFSARLEPNETAVWSFELGQALGEFVAGYDDASKHASNLGKIESIVDRAPQSVNRISVQRLKNFVARAMTPDTDEKNSREQAQTLANLLY
jgi:hypothetical protein